MASSNVPQSEHVRERLKGDPIVWFTTVRADGRPHSVPVWFLWEDESILIFSKPNNQKIRNLRQNPNVILALDNTQGGGDVVIFEGKAQLLSEESKQLEAPLVPYLEKYGARLQRMNWDTDAMLQEYSQPIRVTITRFTSQ